MVLVKSVDVSVGGAGAVEFSNGCFVPGVDDGAVAHDGLGLPAEGCGGRQDDAELGGAAVSGEELPAGGVPGVPEVVGAGYG